MEVRDEFMYSKSHVWVKEEGNTVSVGLTDYAQLRLGDLVFVNLPEVGDEMITGEAFSDVESVKTVADVYAPVTGIICEVNEELMDTPELINEDPYETWLVKAGQITDRDELMDAGDYEDFVESEENAD